MNEFLNFITLKASIVRLTSAYLALRNVFPPRNSSNGQIETMAIGSFLLQTLDGFVLILDAAGKMMYVSETASVHLGLSQVYIYVINVEERKMVN